MNYSAAEQVKKTAWLLFILAKIKILKTRSDDIVDAAYLLCAVVHQVIMLAPKEVSCELVDRKYNKHHNCFILSDYIPEISEK